MVETLRVAGFALTRAVSRQDYMNAPLASDEVITTSECIAPFIPSTWALSWVSNERARTLEQAAKIGLTEHQFADVCAWATEHLDADWGWPNLFTSLSAAEAFRDRFLATDGRARLIAVCLSIEDVPLFLEECAWTSGQAESVMNKLLRGGLPPPEGGVELGTDIIGFEAWGSRHSYLCNHLETDIAEHFKMKPNSSALFDDHDAARRVASWIDAEERGEPVPWFAVRVIDYSKRSAGAQQSSCPQGQGTSLREVP